MEKDLTAQEYFNQLHSLVKNFLNKYRQNVVNQIMHKQDYVDEPKRFFYTLLHKTASTIDASCIFIYNFEHKRDFHSALFIILRATISDLLIAEYLLNCSNSDEEIKEKIERLYFDHINHAEKLFDSTFPYIYKWNAVETEKYRQELKQNSRFYNDDGSAKYKPLSISLNKAIVSLYSSGRDKKTLLYHRRAYDLYNIYSKLEHLGELSFMMIHRGYDDEKQLTLWLDLYDAIIFIFQCLAMYPLIWKNNIEYDQDYYIDELKKIRDLHPDRIKNTA